MNTKRAGSEMTTRAALPQVGIFFFVRENLFIDSTPLSRAGHHGENLVHECGHDEYWAQLVKTGAVPRAGYEEFPRGRVAYDNKSGKFFLFADACILSENNVLDAIMSRLHLPVSDTEKGLAT